MSLMSSMFAIVQDGTAKQAVDAIKDLATALKDEASAESTKAAVKSVSDMLTTHNFGFKQGLAAVGAGLSIVGGGFGSGRLAAAAMESISRQPEAAGDIRGGMILAAALIEGVTLLALITCILAIVLA